MATKGEKTRRDILIQSLTLFSMKGVQNVTTSEIANAVGIKQTGIYRYFKDLNTLLADSIRLAAEEGRNYFQEKIPENLNAKSLLSAHIEKNLKWAIEEKPFNVGFLSVHYFSSQIKEVEIVQKEITKTRIMRFQYIIEQGIREHLWKTKDTEKAAIAIHNTILGEMLVAYNNPKDEPFKKRVERVQTIINKMVELF